MFITSLEDEIGIVSINRPDSRNALNRSMWQGVTELIGELEAKGARTIIFCGEGEVFGAGADLGELKAIAALDQAETIWGAIAGALEAIAGAKAVTIAAVHGACLGGGCLLATACDFRYASTKASFGIPIARLGIILDDRTIARLARLIGEAMVKELLFTARVLASDEALKIGLVTDVKDMSREALITYCRAKALETNQNSRQSIEAAKASLKRISRGNFENNEAEVCASYVSSEFRHRIKQFFQEN